MRTVRKYLAREIYRSTFVVILALLSLFTFFTLVDELDSVGVNLPITSLFYLQALAMPTRLYDLLPIGLLIGTILALAGLAQRNELVILRVSGVSAKSFVGALWVVSIPIMVGALILSEYLTPAAEIKSSEANMLLRGRVEGGMLNSGYWFREPAKDGGTRVINIGRMLASGNVASLKMYEFDREQKLTVMSLAKSGHFGNGQLTMADVTLHKVAPNADDFLSDAIVRADPLMDLQYSPSVSIRTSLTAERLVARILTPERMSVMALTDYITYLNKNQLQADRQIVAIWRKLSYPFTLLVMMTIAAPISFMQTRRGGIGAKVFIGILCGTGFFMINQLSLNVGLLYKWPPIVTALLPNTGAMFIALVTMLSIEHRQTLAAMKVPYLLWKKSAI